MADTGDAPDEAIFDLSKKKKKKKPKDESSGAEKETNENVQPETGETSNKEKTSKSVPFSDENSEKQENVKSEAAAAPEDDDEDDVLVRKKKRKAKTRAGAAETEGKGTDLLEEGEPHGDEGTFLGEYSYDDLLNRIFKLIKDANPSGTDSVDRIKLILKPPQVARIGTKRTSFSNFGEICKTLKRQEKHLYQYLLAELGTNGSIDINSALIIKGRFQQKQLESVLRSYIKEYVICRTCRSADSILQKEERMTFLSCNTCQSRYSVTGIKTGFQAQVGKRAATRAKAT